MQPIRDSGVIKILEETYRKIDKIKSGGKPRFTYQEMLYVYLVHNPGPQHFDDIVGSLFGKKSMIDTIKLCLELSTLIQIPNKNSKTQYKGNSYQLHFHYSNYTKPELMFIKSDDLYKKIFSNRYRIGYHLDY